MARFIVFDVDGTLRIPGKPVELGVVEKMHELVERNIHISLVSGKDADYLFGLAEGLGIPDPLVAGENGAVIFRPQQKIELIYPVKRETRINMDFVRDYLTHEFRDGIWFPPNKAGVTAFTKPDLSVQKVYKSAQAFIEEYRLDDLYVLPHWDAVDVMPKGLDKGIFIRYLNELGYRSEEVVAVGDALNDIPMLRAAGYSITFQSSLPEVKESADIIAESIYEAFGIIGRLIGNGKRKTASK